MSFDLRSWLRRAPKPARLRIKTADGEERFIDLGEGRTKWHTLEETMRTAGATAVECLDAKGAILRAQRLTDEELEARDTEDARDKEQGKAVARAHAELANVLDRYGARMNESFLAGATAASQSQDKLVDLVETLTSHLSVAITNMHNVAANLATIVQTNAETVASLQQALAVAGGGDPSAETNARLLQFVGTALGMGQPPRPAAPPPTPNGKGKHP